MLPQRAQGSLSAYIPQPEVDGWIAERDYRDILANGRYSGAFLGGGGRWKVEGLDLLEEGLLPISDGSRGQ